MDKTALRDNLQLFAESKPNEGADVSETEGVDAATKSAPPKEGTATKEGENSKPSIEELMKDKDFSSNFQKKVDEQVKAALDAKAEEEKLANMSPEEKDAKRAADLEAREKAVLEKELKVSAIEKLTEANAPKELAGLVDYSSEEAMEKSVATILETFNAAVQSGVDGRLAGVPAMKKAPAEKDTVDEEAIMRAIRGE